MSWGVGLLALTWLALALTFAPDPFTGIVGWATTGLVAALVRDRARGRAPRAPGQEAEPVRACLGTTDAIGADEAELPETRDVVILTAPEAAHLLRLPVASVLEALTRGELPGNHLGGEWRIRQDGLLRWLDGPSAGTPSR